MTSSVSPQLIETPTPALGDFFSYPTQVFFASVRSGGSSQVYFMTLNRNCIMNELVTGPWAGAVPHWTQLFPHSQTSQAAPISPPWAFAFTGLIHWSLLGT